MKFKKILPLVLITFLSACSNQQSRVFYFDTMIDIKLFEGNKQNTKDLEKLFDLYDVLSDNYLPRNMVNVYSINHTNEDLPIDAELYNLLKVAFDVQTKGATYFNPLCGSLAKKWKSSLNGQQILDENTINEELLKISNTTLTFKVNNVVQRIGEAEIDLGGIVKGYALDLSYDYLKSNNISHYLIDAGNSSILLGEKNSDDGLFTVGLNNVPNTYMKLKNCFVSTSSISQQGVKIGDITYSHIVNPVNGSAINENDAVIVISDNGALGDALSTSMMMNTIDEIKDIEAEQNVKAIVIKDNKIVYQNSEIEVFNR